MSHLIVTCADYSSEQLKNSAANASQRHWYHFVSQLPSLLILMSQPEEQTFFDMVACTLQPACLIQQMLIAYGVFLKTVLEFGFRSGYISKWISVCVINLEAHWQVS